MKYDELQYANVLVWFKTDHGYRWLYDHEHFRWQKVTGSYASISGEFRASLVDSRDVSSAGIKLKG